MAGWTNRGKFRILDAFFRNQNTSPTFKIALITSGSAPGADTNVFSELTEIAAGQGYTAGGLSVTRDTTDFDTAAENDSTDIGSVQLKDIVWTASGGTLPASGDGARYAVLYDTSTDEVIAYWDLVSDRQVSDGQSFTLQNCELRLSES